MNNLFHKVATSSLLACFAILSAALLALSGCAQKTTEATAPPPPTAVMVSYPIERAVTDSAEFAGRTAAVNMVEVRARLSGYLDQINFKEGALVKKGDVLFVIDQRPYVAELNRSKSQLNQAEASLAESKAKLDEAKAQHNRAIAGYDYAQHHIERSKTLVAGNVVTQEEMELEKSELLQAQADVERAKAQIASSQAAINTAQAAVEAAHANLAVAELNLTYTKVIAPIDGRISRELVTEGNLVQAGLDGGGMLLTTIVSIDPVYANFDVDEGTVLKLQRLNREGKGDSLHDGRFPVQLGLANEDGFPHTGVLNFVDNQVNPGTGTLRLRGVFANRDESLAPGFFARIRLPIGKPHQALLISESALDSDQGQRIVYVVGQNNKIEARAVQLGDLHEGLRAVESGVQAGDRIVVNGLQQVRRGITVEAKLVAMPGSAENRKASVAKSTTESQASETKRGAS